MLWRSKGNVYTVDITTSLAVSDEGSSLKGEKRESGRGARRERKRKRGREGGRRRRSRRVQLYIICSDGSWFHTWSPQAQVPDWTRDCERAWLRTEGCRSLSPEPGVPSSPPSSRLLPGRRHPVTQPHAWELVLCQKTQVYIIVFPQREGIL